MLPRLSFWYGIPLREWLATPILWIIEYANRLGGLLAEYRIVQAEAASYPHLTANAQRDASNRWYRLASREETHVSQSITEGTARLAQMGIKVIGEKRDESEATSS